MPRLPDCRIVGKELTFVFPSNGDALVGYRTIRDAVEAAEKAVAPPAPDADFLEVGCKYYDRGGNIWTVESRTPGVTPYPYRALMTSPCGRLLAAMFCADGRYHHTCEPLYDLKYYVEFEDHYDLIKRVGAAPKTEPAPKPPLQLRVGGWWRDGAGHEWEVFAHNRESLYPFYAWRDGGKHVEQFCANGRWSITEKTFLDLIEEIAPPPAPKPPLQLRVGAHYKRSDGMTGRVDFRSLSGYFLWEGTDGLRRTYNEDGTARRQFEGVKNLIEEIAPPPCPTRHDCRAGQTERCTCCDKEG